MFHVAIRMGALMVCGDGLEDDADVVDVLGRVCW